MNDLEGVPVIKPDWYDGSEVPWEAIRAVCASNEYNMTRRRLLREWNGCEDEEDIRFKQLNARRQKKYGNIPQKPAHS